MPLEHLNIIAFASDFSQEEIERARNAGEALARLNEERSGPIRVLEEIAAELEAL